MTDRKKLEPTVLASYLLMALALFITLYRGLLSALLAGLLVYSLVHLLAPLLERKISGGRARMIAVAALGAIVVTALSLATWGAVSFFQSDAGNMQVLLQKMADIIEASRQQIPAWLRDHLPDDADALREMITSWLREHAVEAKSLGEEAGRTAAHLLIGMIIGAMIALREAAPEHAWRPLAAALRDRIVNLDDAFQRIVFAQVRIAAINAVLTGLYLLLVLPAAGIQLPLTKTLILITFAAGLLPVIGNLISNTVLVIVALSHSLNIAVISLLFLVVIHKLEYFLNARIIGSHIQARSWELLVAMLVMESIFGLPGVIAAPVFYAYLKKELTERGLV
ncbi:MAG TPA: AI-2E family transporter [Paucimonas sp.]|nr:AI-2E family transporter [Paucimonas sp.]